MEILILLLIILAVYKWVIKPQKDKESIISTVDHTSNGTASVPIHENDNCPADALINSPYYEKYKEKFDYIWRCEKYAKNKIDWLLQSLNSGKELEDGGIYVTLSVGDRFPYYCETEEEYTMLVDSTESALKGSVRGILNLGYTYNVGNPKCYHPAKREYWKSILVDMAQSGNYEAQAALCTGKQLFSEEEMASYKLIYENKILELAENGEPNAQLAVGQFISLYASDESRSWLEKAANQDLSDACYWLAKSYKSYILFDENIRFRSESLENETELYDLVKNII